MSDSKRSPLRPVFPGRAGEQCRWEGLSGSAGALALLRTAELIDRPLLLIARDTQAASRLLDALNFYSAGPDSLACLSFPDWETLPYDQFSPYQDIVSDRLETLINLGDLRRGILIVPVATLMHRLLPASYLHSHSLALNTGQQLDQATFRARLQDSGYRHVPQVMEHGDVAVRGSLLDIFPMGAATPYRLDLFGDVIDSIRGFDVETQRSKEQVEAVRILPAREIPLTPEGINQFRANWRARFEGNPNDSPLYRDVSAGLAPAGIEYYLPLFYGVANSLLDYLKHTPLAVLDGNIRAAAETFFADVEERHEQGRYDRERPLLAPAELYLPPAELLGKIEALSTIQLGGHGDEGESTPAVVYATRPPPALPVDARAADPLAPLKNFLREFPGRALLVAESPGRRETLLELLRRHSLQAVVLEGWREFLAGDCALGLCVAPLELGALIEDPGLAVISETQLFGERAQQQRLRRRRQVDTEAIIRDLTELRAGSPVVHEEHGVGRYLGLVTLKVGEITGEYIQLEYDQGDKLYVPVASLDLISRYTGVDPEHAPLHRLGSGQWQKARSKAAEKVRDVAAELLELHARRAARPGFNFHFDADAYQAFVQGFPFEETPGQEDAIRDVIRDMCSDKAMDRLICGDSGFGKTEVAMRSAFLAVQNNRQVALLVPTTLLAQQHFQNFQDRFADWPVRIELLSRFRGKKEQDQVMDQLAQGRVDIVIGTHKLLQAGIRFARLGLAIIDEEHRFGVRQKERFKALRSEVDVLTLTATPIPRTLNLALTELRDISIIATPPSRRLPVRTFIREWNETLVHEALARELARGGQVYYLHNKVEDIEKRAAEIQALMPQAHIRHAHGQMPEKILEQVMLDFYHQRFNILVCTTIVETGIDVPNANTIIIDRADKFGLAQLYQLRGRVGRSHHRAYAYLLIPGQKAMTRDAVKRLEAIESLEELGIGFTLATHDLEIRGAGEILGEDQSGQIHEIGYGMYMDLLQRTVRDLRAGRQPQLDRPLDHGVEVELGVPALIPGDYLPDAHMRLILYKRIASAESEAGLQDIQEEMIDRFGLLPAPAKNLFRIGALKQKARGLGIRKIELGAAGGRLHFSEATTVDPVRLIKLVQTSPRHYRFDGQDRLRLTRELPDAEMRFKVLEELLAELG